MRLSRFELLRAPEGDPAGGGGGPGGGANDPPKPITEEDIGRIANAAFTSQLKRLNLEGKIAEAIGSLKLEDKFAALAETLKPSGGGDPEPSKGKGVDPELAKQLKTLSDKLEAAEAARLAATQEVEKTKREHEFGSARQRLYESLKPHASESLHDVWVDHLIHHKRLDIKDGKPMLEVEHSPFKGMPKQKEFLSLEDAIPVLIAAEDSKRFMAPPDGADGQRLGQAPRNRGNGAGASRPALDSKNPADRVRARLAEYGMDFDTEFS